MIHEVLNFRFDRETIRKLEVLTADIGLSRSGLVRFLIAESYRKHIQDRQHVPELVQPAAQVAEAVSHG